MRHLTAALLLSCIAASLPSPVSAQLPCSTNSNPSGSWAASYAAYESQFGHSTLKTAVKFVNVTGVPLEICYVDQYHEDPNLLGSVCGWVEFRRGHPTGPLVGVRSSEVTIPGSPGLVRMPLPLPVVAEPGETYFIVRGTVSHGPFTPPTSTQPLGTTGPTSEVWEYHPGYGTQIPPSWNNIGMRSYLYSVGFRLFGNARFRKYGRSCGTIEPCGTTPFREINWNNSPLLVQQPSSNSWAFRVDDPGGQQPTRDICAIDLRFNAPGETQPRDVTVNIHADNGFTDTPGEILTQMTVAVQPGLTPVLHHIPFPYPVRITGSDPFWVSFDVTFTLQMPVVSFGNQTMRLCINDGPGWVFQNDDWNWSIRTYTTTQLRQDAPHITATFPRVGQTATTSLQDARANSPAALLYGQAQSDLPLDILGITGCALQVDQVTASIPRMTGSSGNASVSWLVSTNPAFFGTTYYVQWAVLSPGTNPFGVTLSQGGEAIVGN